MVNNNPLPTRNGPASGGRGCVDRQYPDAGKGGGKQCWRRNGSDPFVASVYLPPHGNAHVDAQSRRTRRTCSEEVEQARLATGRGHRAAGRVRGRRGQPAKAAVGDTPVFAYISSLPQPQRGIAERIDQLAARTLPGLQRSVKWGMAYYGVGNGWCFCCGAFARHVKLMFVNGVTLQPVPPVTPLAMGKATRGVELASADDIDERQIGAWMKQIAARPGVGQR